MSGTTIRVTTHSTINASITDNQEGLKSFNGFTPPPKFSVERFSISSDESGGEYEVAEETLEREIGHLIDVVKRVFTRAEKQTQTEIQLDEIEIFAEVNGEGKVSLLGSGVQAGGKGGIKLKFKRQQENG
ncbi:MAG: hypothetical protein F6K40_19080 [Okeania sp. SIO3I5]|uniref:Pepco domain-containing protein n=1 Tax=Okeania sp. SIO3I5 TaxID=2607805 RepID=UPI0013B75915|nr:hypothetical protein [Okeania sp. SIO3I5]NEQ38250.1 hypothetical protein [Okeania sp. SIO3I5]